MLCMCICVQAYECAGMHTCVHVCGDQRRTFNVFLYWSAAHYFELGLLVNWKSAIEIWVDFGNF